MTNLNTLSEIRNQLSLQRFCDEAEAIQQLSDQNALAPELRSRIEQQAADLVMDIRNDSQPGLMEQFLAEYGLSTREGVALMCLAEAYLRTPDALSLDALIRDKIGEGDWGSHIGSAGSFLVNASTWALMLTGRMFKQPKPGEQPLSDVMLQAIGRMGEAVTQKAIQQAMKILGKQFVLGRNIREALNTSNKAENRDYRYSFDMLGEAARTAPDAEKYFQAYASAIQAIAEHATASELHDRSGISVKLSALHPRYEQVQHARVMQQLVPKVLTLATQACNANIGFTIDAEEADRLELSLDVIEAVLSTPELAGWDGFGVVVQAYSKQAPLVIKWLETLAQNLSRRITVRLVKGAYWDYEIKNAQVLGMQNYPVYTRKISTDVSYLCCAQILLDASETIYPQFATHNAHSASAILEMVKPGQQFEFQRLHGMGEALHRLIKRKSNQPCRIYAPVGVHKDLLAYLVRRLLENGANSSFVNKLLDERSPAQALVKDPVNAIAALSVIPNPRIPLPDQLYAEQRLNSSGINLNLPLQQSRLDDQLKHYQNKQWRAEPKIAGYLETNQSRPVFSPALPQLKVGEVSDSNPDAVQLAIENASKAFDNWCSTPVSERAQILDNIAELYQENQAELIALATLEAGKTRLDGILEIREAIDFCRYYAAQARTTLRENPISGIGPVVCISPWNFPLAIFTGQIAAALVSGNPVLAKPAEQTTLIAAFAIDLMHQAGIPKNVLQFVPGSGAIVGQALTSSRAIKGVCFTGSTDTATLIDKTLSIHGDQDCRLIAETGGLNTMIVDSTALLEQVARDVTASAFQSAGQRCSALRILCIQEEIEAPLLEMLEGAAQQLVIGDPWQVATDVGPVIDEEAQQVIINHCDAMTQKGRLLFKVNLPAGLPQGYFVSPVAFRLENLQELKQEIFGPVLHIVSFKAAQLDQLIKHINDSGFGLTMGVHSRIDTRVKHICQSAKVGNIYVNRNQIGAVVGTQPFGGQGLSGTGPKAGGSHYLSAFCRKPVLPNPQSHCSASEMDEYDRVILNKLKATKELTSAQALWDIFNQRDLILSGIAAALPDPYSDIATSACAMDRPHIQQLEELPGPTGEKNQLSVHGRGVVLCLGGGENHEQALIAQVFRALMTGNVCILNTKSNHIVAVTLENAFQKAGLFERVIWVNPENTDSLLANLGCSAVMYDGRDDNQIRYRQLLAARTGERIALISSKSESERLMVEKVVSTDTTASGGNAELLACDAENG